MYEINKTVLDITVEALDAYIANIRSEIETAEDNAEQVILESQMKTALFIRAMFNSMELGESIMLVDGGHDATVMPYIKRMEAKNG